MLLAPAHTPVVLLEKNGCLLIKKILTLFFFYMIFVARSYDAAKEEGFQQQAKQRELQRIEEALQTAARRGETGVSGSHPRFCFPVLSLLLLLFSFLLTLGSGPCWRFHTSLC